MFERTLSLAWTQAQVQLHHLGIGTDEAHLFQRLANAVLYSDASLRPSSETLGHSTLERAALWAHGISGDLPIVLVRIDKAEDVDIVRQLLRAHEYWRMRQLSADVIIMNEKASSYEQGLQGSLEALVRGSQLRLCPDTGGARGSIYLLRTDLISAQERMLLQQAARVVLLSRRGTLTEQVTRLQRRHSAAPPNLPSRRVGTRLDVPLPERELEFFNGLGGFAEDGREYVTILGEGLRTPQPWINVIANPSFGFLVSESGSGFTWSLNSHENQLTPWSNDPVTDPSGEVLYIRDDNSEEVWSPTALPIRDDPAPYVACHGQGYSRFHHGSHGILVELLQFVPPEDPIKISRLTLQNASGRSRRLSVTAYAEWVLGSSRSDSAPYIITEIDPETGALFARNAWGGEFGGRIAFVDLAGKQTSWTGDRTEFLGRNGTPERPQALEREGELSGKVGAGLDPCGALRLSIALEPDERAEVVWFLGQTEGRGAGASVAQPLSRRRRERALARGYSPMGRRAGRRTGPHAGAGYGCIVESLGALSDAGLPGLGARGVLSAEWGLRVSRPASGCHGPERRGTRCHARASAAGGSTAVCRRRRAALVASSIGTRCTDPYFRRPALVAVRGHPVP